MKDSYELVACQLKGMSLSNLVSSPLPGDVLQGLGTYMFPRGIVYWGMAIVLLITTMGRLGDDTTHCSNA